MTLKVRILPFLTTFAQLSARLKNFLRGWLLVLGQKEGVVECATVCVKSVVILKNYFSVILTFIKAIDALFMSNSVTKRRKIKLKPPIHFSDIIQKKFIIGLTKFISLYSKVCDFIPFVYSKLIIVI